MKPPRTRYLRLSVFGRTWYIAFTSPRLIVDGPWRVSPKTRRRSAEAHAERNGAIQEAALRTRDDS